MGTLVALKKDGHFTSECEKSMIKPFQKLRKYALEKINQSTKADEGVQDFVSDTILPPAMDFVDEQLESLIHSMAEKVKMLPFLAFKKVLRSLRLLVSKKVHDLNKRWNTFAKAFSDPVSDETLLLQVGARATVTQNDDSKLKSKLQRMNRRLKKAKEMINDLFNGAKERAEEFGRIPSTLMHALVKITQSKEAKLLAKLGKATGVSNTWLSDMQHNNGRDFWFSVKGRDKGRGKGRGRRRKEETKEETKDFCESSEIF